MRLVREAPPVSSTGSPRSSPYSPTGTSVWQLRQSNTASARPRRPPGQSAPGPDQALRSSGDIYLQHEASRCVRSLRTAITSRRPSAVGRAATGGGPSRTAVRVTRSRLSETLHQLHRWRRGSHPSSLRQLADGTMTFSATSSEPGAAQRISISSKVPAATAP